MRTFAGEYDGPGSPDEETLLEATGHPQTDEGQDVRPCQDGEARQVDRVGTDKNDYILSCILRAHQNDYVLCGSVWMVIEMLRVT